MSDDQLCKSCAFDDAAEFESHPDQEFEDAVEDQVLMTIRDMDSDERRNASAEEEAQNMANFWADESDQWKCCDFHQEACRNACLSSATDYFRANL